MQAWKVEGFEGVDKATYERDAGKLLAALRKGAPLLRWEIAGWEKDGETGRAGGITVIAITGTQGADLAVRHTVQAAQLAWTKFESLVVGIRDLMGKRIGNLLAGFGE